MLVWLLSVWRCTCSAGVAPIGVEVYSAGVAPIGVEVYSAGVAAIGVLETNS